MRLARKRTNSELKNTDQFAGLVGPGAGLAGRRPPVQGALFRHPAPDRKRRGAGRGQAAHHPRPGQAFRPVARRRHRRLRDADRPKALPRRGWARAPSWPGQVPRLPQEKAASRAPDPATRARPAADRGRHRFGPAHRAHLPPADVAPSRPAHARAVPLWRSARRHRTAPGHRRLSALGARRALRRASDRRHRRRAAGARSSDPRHDPARRCGVGGKPLLSDGAYGAERRGRQGHRRAGR